jgi:Fe-S-cluster containining protein
MSEYPIPGRLSFPDAERAQPWLAALLDAFLEIDRGVHEAVRREEAQGRRLACACGCAACCRTHQDIPIYPLELMGLYWYGIECLQGQAKARLASQLRGFIPGGACPFLLDDACAVHPLRPMACRQFNVLDRVCAEGEDAFHTRRGDVATPIRRFADAAFDRLLTFHGIGSKGERREAIKDGRLHALARPIQSVDWSALAARMERTPA